MDWEESTKQLHHGIDTQMSVILNILKYYLANKEYGQLTKIKEKAQKLLTKSMHLSFTRNQLIVMHQIYKWKTGKRQDRSKDIEIVWIKDNDCSILNRSLHSMVESISIQNNRTIGIEWFK